MLRRSALVLWLLTLAGFALSACIAVVGVPSMAAYEGQVSTAGSAPVGGGGYGQDMPTVGAGAHLPIPTPIPDQGSWERLFASWGH